MRRSSKAILVFIVMSALTMQVFTRFLDSIPGADVSRGLKGVNAVLDFILISRVGVVPATVLLAVLTIALTILAHRRGQAAMGQPASASPDRQVSDADRELLSKLLDGLVGQAVHEQGMIAASGHEPVVVRLAPQIPIRDHQRPRSWLGGAPAMPEHLPWPEIDGAATNFLAQICCADLPADLWGGAGPRDGWLAFFIHPSNYEMRVLHLPEAGPSRRGPDSPAEDGWFSVQRPDGPPPDSELICPRWPLDLVAVRPGDPDPRREGRSEARFARYKQGYDLASPEHQPFDWPSTLAMLDIAQKHIEQRLAADWVTPLTTRLDKVNEMLAAAELAPEPRKDLAELRQQAEELPRIIEARRKAPALLENALLLVQRLTATVQEHSAHAPFSPAAISSIMQALHAQPSMSWKGKLLPLTAHEAGAGLWAEDFEALRSNWVRYVYTETPMSLPPAVRSYFEALWRDIAAHEMAGTGHVPFRYVHEFDLDSDVTLIELPTSNLMGWMFGDVDNLVVTMSKADLAAGRFDRLNVQVSN